MTSVTTFDPTAFLWESLESFRSHGAEGVARLWSGIDEVQRAEVLSTMGSLRAGKNHFMTWSDEDHIASFASQCINGTVIDINSPARLRFFGKTSKEVAL